MPNIESFYFADTAHILTCMSIDKFKRAHTHTHTPTHILLPKLSRVTLGCSHTLLHTQPPRTPICPLIPHTFPYTPTFIYKHTHTHTHPHIAWLGPAPPLTWRHMSLARYLGSPQMMEGHLHGAPSVHLHMSLPARGCSRGWCTGASFKPAPWFSLG